MTACIHGEVCREYLRQRRGIICQTCPTGCRFYEPEERTCRMIDNGVELCCSVCDRRHGYDDEPDFCMGCGAKVVEQ